MSTFAHAARYTFYAQRCPPPSSTNVFCCITMKSTAGEQDGIPHILQRYLRASLSLPLSLYLYRSKSLPSWGHDLVLKNTTFIKLYLVKINLYSFVLCPVEIKEGFTMKATMRSTWAPLISPMFHLLSLTFRIKVMWTEIQVEKKIKSG